MMLDRIAARMRAGLGCRRTCAILSVSSLLLGIAGEQAVADDCSVEPSSLDYGTVSDVPVDAVFTIRATAPVTGDVTSPCLDFAIVAGGGPFSLAGGDSVKFVVRFSPVREGPTDCLISLGTDCPDVFVQGDADLCSVQPTSINLGSVAVGTAVPTQFTITNISSRGHWASVSTTDPNCRIIGDTEDYMYGDAIWTVDLEIDVVAPGPFSCTVDVDSTCVDQVMITGNAELDLIILSVDDVPADQGYNATVVFRASMFDIPGSSSPIVQYEVFREIGIAKAPSAIASFGGPMISDASILAEGWDYVGAVPATQAGSYATVVSTLVNLTFGIALPSTFMVRAVVSPHVFFDSAPATGVSIDNLAPAAPTGLSVDYGFTIYGNQLDWDTAPESDFMYFAIYAGEGQNFVPDPLNPAHETIGTSWIDLGGRHVTYKISAFDIHGNESPVGMAISVTNAPEMPPGFRLDQNAPNPFNPKTTISYHVAAGGAHVLLEVFDVRGKRLTTLVNEFQLAGPRSVRWDGTDEQGTAVSAGVYFYRLAAGSFLKTRRMVLVP